MNYLARISKNTMVSVAALLFVALTIWWVSLSPFSTDESLIHSKYIWGSTYQLLALWGGICGLMIAKSWGGFKSFFGKSIIFFAIGLLLQSFGQTVYSYFNLVANIQAPYPSLGDVGFFGSIIFYILGVIYLGKVSGVHLSLKGFAVRIQSILIPLLMLVVSYMFFLKNYEFDWSNPLRVFLDFGYPFGQAIYVSLAIFILLVSRNVLGGIMRLPIIFILIALIIQYISDFNFLYSVSHETWLVGGIGDFLYMFSYFMMALSLIQLRAAFDKIKNIK